MRKCKQCETKPVYQFTNKTKLCGKCFIHYFERKVFRTIRQYQMCLSKISGNKNDIRYKILKIISEKINIDRKSKCKTRIENLNDASIAIIYCIMKKNINELKKQVPKTNKTEMPLYFISDNEIMLYAKLKRISGKIKRKENKLQKEINILFSELEKNDPDVRHAVVNALVKI